jgi:hypothetical protein
MGRKTVQECAHLHLASDAYFKTSDERVLRGRPCALARPAALATHLWSSMPPWCCRVARHGLHRVSGSPRVGDDDGL